MLTFFLAINGSMGAGGSGGDVEDFRGMEMPRSSDGEQSYKDSNPNAVPDSLLQRKTPKSRQSQLPGH
jgi:hypothetical protein